jgi:Secretion system C-terminal sorting domain
MDEANDFRDIVAGYNIHGAFGGGGGSRRYNEAGNDGFNGGGGYNGGGAGLGGGGGGSYLNGALVGAATASDTGNGFVTISYIPPLTQVIDIYPNPNSGVFTVNGLLLGQVVEIYNCLGQKIQTLQASNTFMQLDLSAYASGVYFYRVSTDSGTLIGEGKVIVER